LHFLSNSAVLAIAPPWQWPGKIAGWLGQKVGGEAFTWLLNVVHDAFNSVLKTFDKQYVHAASVKPSGAVLDYYFGSSMGLTRYLAWGAFLVALVMAVVPGGGSRFLRGAKVVVGVAMAPIFFMAMDWMATIQSSAAHLAVGLYTPTGKYADQPLLLVPVADNPLFALMGMGWVFTWGGLLLLMFKGYAVIGTVSCLLLLPCFALSVFSDGALKFMNVLISTIIVTKIAGIPLALFIMKLAEALSQSVDALNDPLGQTASIGFGLIFAWASQFLLFWACLKVVNPITGKVYSRGKSKTQVSGGKLKAETTEKRRQRRHASFNASFLNRRPSHGRNLGGTTAKGQAARKGVKSGAAMLAKRYPATALGAAAAKKVASARSNGRPATSRPEPRSGASRNGSGPG
jgi:hypothetical protein